ncbi:MULTISPECIES: metalloregulator ArsR/SmtB family transcription factor [Vibrio]|uniref:Putative ArsR family transcriptional regulator n=1 Tax=Vibrio halioticoli NBRC 102217 TaxID=1219072 RepID=V5HL35_9VIBR|nr:metalloregulator ArsR/SmtB family transcription factor [Vibrio sp. B1Z05]GAD89885.1 putative ArsR family transcriptional regulator [Vibrio halioticoli NBRC 102217]
MQDIFEALSDPHRRKILDMLKHGELCSSDIASQLDITPASVTHHLNKLRSANLIIKTRKGRNIYYTVHTSLMEDVLTYMYSLIDTKGLK